MLRRIIPLLGNMIKKDNKTVGEMVNYQHTLYKLMFFLLNVPDFNGWFLQVHFQKYKKYEAFYYNFSSLRNAYNTAIDSFDRK